MQESRDGDVRQADQAQRSEYDRADRNFEPGLRDRPLHRARHATQAAEHPLERTHVAQAVPLLQKGRRDYTLCGRALQPLPEGVLMFGVFPLDEEPVEAVDDPDY